jgi:regulator of replication initiation timing
MALAQNNVAEGKNDIASLFICNDALCDRVEAITEAYDTLLEKYEKIVAENTALKKENELLRCMSKAMAISISQTASRTGLPHDPASKQPMRWVREGIDHDSE